DIENGMPGNSGRGCRLWPWWLLLPSCRPSPRPTKAAPLFWAPGTFASFSAIPQQPPGWSLAIVDYYASTSAGADVATARAVTAGRIPTTIRLDETSTYKSGHDTLNINPGYAFATPVFGGQFSVGLTVAAGTQTVELERALTATVGSTVITR